MAMANLYGFGRLAWNPELTTDEIIDGWTRHTFGNDPQVVSTIDALQLIRGTRMSSTPARWVWAR